jgi:hypothetical protein
MRSYRMSTLKDTIKSSFSHVTRFAYSRNAVRRVMDPIKQGNGVSERALDDYDWRIVLRDIEQRD